MDNREVLVKLQYTTKYGVQLYSSRIIKNYNLYKYLVLKHIPEQVYIDYSNEDCELVNLNELFEKSTVISDKCQIESYNNLKQLLYKDVNTQYDLFTLIDNSYNDVFGHIVENDLSFSKYSYFFKQFLELSKTLMSKYVQYIGTDEFPKDMNQLYLKELGNERYSKLLEWLQEPIVNDVNINCVINYIIHTSGIKVPNTIPNITNIPLHREATCHMNKDIRELFTIKEKVIITMNSNGLYTFKDLIFNLQSSLVIGKWNSQKMIMENLKDEDIELCKYYNLKYDENSLHKNQSDIKELEETNQMKTNLQIDNENLEKNNQIYEEIKNSKSDELNNIKNLLKIKQFTNNENISTDITICSIGENNFESSNTEETQEQNNENEEILEQNNENEKTINPYSNDIIPLVNEKVSKGRKKTTITTSVSNLKPKLPNNRKKTQVN